jgi:hypothetical protein
MRDGFGIGTIHLAVFRGYISKTILLTYGIRFVRKRRQWWQNYLIYRNHKGDYLDIWL